MSNNIKVALYYRISKEDLEDNGKNESDSIDNQRLMLTQYAREKDWVIYDEYIDDGLTGTNFERAEFNRMERDIENGEINVILVKDQSRIGRNFAGVDVFLYDYLIEKRVRCIGVTDGLDNFNQDNKKATQVTGLTNEWYAEDISLKVRGSFDAKRKAGQFIGSVAPYGYVKHPDNRNQLIVDEEVEHVIRKIYDMYIAGNGYVKIAKTLTEDGIPNPSTYKDVFNYNGGQIKVNHWSYHTIRRMLLNEVYAGNMVQKKTKTISYKNNARVNTHPSEVIRVEGTHEPIIDKNTFKLVQDMMAKNSKSKPTRASGKKHIFAGIIKCGDCGRTIAYRSDTQTYFCNTYTRYGMGLCTRHYIKFDEIHDAVLEDIKYHIDLFVQVKDLKTNYNKFKQTRVRKDILEQSISRNENRINEVLKLKKNIYEDYRNDILDMNDYKQLREEYNKEEIELIDQTEKLKEQRLKEKNDIDKYNKWEDFSKKYVDLEKLNAQVLNELIDVINVYETDDKITLEVNYKFKQPYVDYVLDEYQENTQLGR